MSLLVPLIDYGLRDYGVDSQIGLEPTPAEYVANLVQVFAECWRVLRDDGTLWLNLGDSYANQKNGDTYSGFNNRWSGTGINGGKQAETFRNFDKSRKFIFDGFKPKDLIGIPWRVAFALQDFGWYLRSDIIWHKPNPMPESVTDRPTKSHEYVFLLTKSQRYYYDAEAIKEPHSRDWWNETVGSEYMTAKDGRNDGGKRKGNGDPTGRNKRTVWTVPTSPYKGAHFATFPPELIKPMILAGTSSAGCCSKCGAPMERVVGREKPPANVYTKNGKPEDIAAVSHPELGKVGMGQKLQNWYNEHPTQTLGWKPTCTCNADTIPCTVLDPFSGSGTTAAEAIALGRNAIGIELNPEYIELAKVRAAQPGFMV